MRGSDPALGDRRLDRYLELETLFLSGFALVPSDASAVTNHHETSGSGLGSKLDQM